jgi:hypothetical protein
MTRAEIRDYIRLQLSEDVEGYYLDTDLDSYINRAVVRFVNKAAPIVIHKSFDIDETKQAEAAVSEVFEITCVEANAGAIGGQYFKIYDKDDTEYLVWYDVADGSTAPTGDNLIEVDIGASDSNTTVASATSSAINATSGFTATVNSEVVTVTVDAG